MTPQPTLLPFDLAKALAGARIVTRDGQSVGSITYDGKDMIDGILNGLLSSWWKNGRRYQTGEESRYDLFLRADSQEAGAISNETVGIIPTATTPTKASSDVSALGVEAASHFTSGPRDPNYDDELKAAREEIARLKEQFEKARQWNALCELELKNLRSLNEGLEEEIERLESRLKKSDDYIKQMDAVIDDERVANSCINPLEDLKRAIAKLKADRTTAETHAKAVEGQLETTKRNYEHENAGLRAEIDHLRNALLRPATAGPEVRPKSDSWGAGTGIGFGEGGEGDRR